MQTVEVKALIYLGRKQILALINFIRSRIRALTENIQLVGICWCHCCVSASYFVSFSTKWENI